MTDLKKLSIADLKAALDFIREQKDENIKLNVTMNVDSIIGQLEKIESALRLTLSVKTMKLGRDSSPN